MTLFLIGLHRNLRRYGIGGGRFSSGLVLFAGLSQHQQESIAVLSSGCGGIAVVHIKNKWWITKSRALPSCGRAAAFAGPFASVTEEGLLRKFSAFS